MIYIAVASVVIEHCKVFTAFLLIFSSNLTLDFNERIKRTRRHSGMSTHTHTHTLSLCPLCRLAPDRILIIYFVRNLPENINISF